MKSKRIFFQLIASLLLTVSFFTFSCQKKDIISNDASLKLAFSNDSVIFDTVFTSLGSISRQLMVYNPSANRIKISQIQLAQGAQSAYRINIDGEAATDFYDLELAGGDSAYIFVRVTIDPNDQNNPYVVEDQIRFLTNGNEQIVKLVAWGQNAHYIVADQIVANFPPFTIVADSLETVHWTSEKPYVIYGYAVIDSYGELIIDEGTRVYFHDKSGLWAYTDGVLKVYGTEEAPVVFQGDRLEAFYADLPGQWDRIWLMEGRAGVQHEIRNAIIQNGFIGLQTESFLSPAQNKLVLHNVTIRNMQGIGIFSRLFNIEGSNVVIANCGGYDMALTMGGSYHFKHTTLANYWNYSVRNTPSLFLNNYTLDSLDNVIPFPINFSMANSLLYGYNKDEFETDMTEAADSLYFFDHCLMKTNRETNDGPAFNTILKNEDPLFLDHSINDYRIDTLSPAINFGDPAVAASVPLDILGHSRSESADVGAYQFVPGQSGRRR